MNGLLPQDEHLETEHEVLSEMVQEAQIPDLPMDGWPLCFGPARISADGKYYEVILNETAGDEAGNIWKFHPPKESTAVLRLTEELRHLPPFVSDGDLTEDLELLCDYAAKKWIIEDTFIDHVTDRFGFRDSHRDFWQYSKKNSRIGRNIMTQLGAAVCMIKRSIGEIPTRLNTLGNRIESEKYDDKTFDEKVAFIEEIDQDIVEYLRAIHSHLSSK